MTNDDRELLERADEVAKQAYAPYSNFFVGAAIRTRDGRIFDGANVENAAYPLGICAEKTAIARSVAEGCAPGDLAAIGITASPCGGCTRPASQPASAPATTLAAIAKMIRKRPPRRRR